VALAEKEIVIDATDAKELQAVARDAKEIGVKRLLSRDASLKTKFVDGLSVVQVSTREGDGTTAAWVQINGVKDVDAAVEASKKGHSFVVVQCNNWKIIPLENLIADFQRRKKRLYAYMKDKGEIELAFNILEKGVDGIVIPAQSLETAKQLIHSLRSVSFSTAVATVKKVVDAGVGERACIDTASQLSMGEGLLIGSKSSFFFLVHGETIPS
jgi:3-dehydroquinate synthase II